MGKSRKKREGKRETTGNKWELIYLLPLLVAAEIPGIGIQEKVTGLPTPEIDSLHDKPSRNNLFQTAKLLTATQPNRPSPEKSGERKREMNITSTGLKSQVGTSERWW